MTSERKHQVMRFDAEKPLIFVSGEVRDTVTDYLIFPHCLAKFY